MLNIFERLVRSAVSFSEASGGILTNNSGIQSTKIYTRITLSAMTINGLLLANSVNRTSLLDFPSVATLTRAFIETCHRYFYLSQLDLCAAEAAFRLKLFYYHMNSEKLRFCKETGERPEVQKRFEDNLPQDKLELMSSSIYAALTKEVADKVRKGVTDMHLTNDEVAAQFGLIGGQFKPIYRLLSNHSHGSPFSTYSQSNERGRGEDNVVEREYLILILKLLNQYLSRTIVSQVELLSLKGVHPDDYRYAQEIFYADRT